MIIEDEECLKPHPSASHVDTPGPSRHPNTLEGLSASHSHAVHSTSNILQEDEPPPPYSRSSTEPLLPYPSTRERRKRIRSPWLVICACVAAMWLDFFMAIRLLRSQTVRVHARMLPESGILTHKRRDIVTSPHLWNLLDRIVYQLLTGSRSTMVYPPSRCSFPHTHPNYTLNLAVPCGVISAYYPPYPTTNVRLHTKPGSIQRCTNQLNVYSYAAFVQRSVGMAGDS
jgi:hypothetical protein